MAVTGGPEEGGREGREGRRALPWKQVMTQLLYARLSEASPALRYGGMNVEGNPLFWTQLSAPSVCAHYNP